MNNNITKDQWILSQKEQINQHAENFNLNETNKNQYYNSYKTIFSLLDSKFDWNLQNKKVLEIGSGVFGALTFCNNTENSFIIEPLDFPENVTNVYKDKGIAILKGMVEELDLPQVDEIYLFNVMQSIWQPEIFIKKLKKVAKKIYFLEPIDTSVDVLHLHSYTFDDFRNFFGEEAVSQYNGGSIPQFHSANCAYGIWDKTSEISNNISVVGIGKLGLCFALSLEKSGYNVCGVDINQNYVDLINKKEYKTSEPFVEEYLNNSANFTATTDLQKAVEFSNTIFCIVATPSLPDGKYDHAQIDALRNNLKALGRQENKKHLIVCCTVMPGFTDVLNNELEPFNWACSYNPEFIAQGTVIKNQENPDMILIGEGDVESGKRLEKIYKRFCKNQPKINRMSRLSAEITKIGLNCFLTTKIAFANMIGDLSETMGAETDKILTAIGNDSRIGSKFLKYGYGYGGPCLVRDGRALGIFASENNCYSYIPLAADKSNNDHLLKQVELMEKKLNKNDVVTFNSVTYKPESILIEESQQLKVAVELAKRGYKVVINERQEVIDAIKPLYGDLLNYKTRVVDKNKKVISFCLFGNKEIYTQGAIENAKLALLHYPGWECRVYVEDTISEDIKNKLKDLDAVVYNRTNSGGFSPLYWRFEPIKDKDVYVWISRDVDSRLSEKEALAVQDWLKSGKTFHLMRDAHNHDLYPVMAGMFGVRNDLTRTKYPNLVLDDPAQYVNLRDGDQLMLRDRIWGMIENDHICHEHWAHNIPVSNVLKHIGRNPNEVYEGQGVHGHVTSRRKNYPNHFTDLSINRPFPEHSKIKYGLYIGQRINENNIPSYDEEIQWEYDLRGENFK